MKFTEQRMKESVTQRLWSPPPLTEVESHQLSKLSGLGLHLANWSIITRGTVDNYYSKFKSLWKSAVCVITTVFVDTDSPRSWIKVTLPWCHTFLLLFCQYQQQLLWQPAEGKEGKNTINTRSRSSTFKLCGTRMLT